MCKPVKCPQCGHEFAPERATKSGAWTPEEDELLLRLYQKERKLIDITEAGIYYFAYSGTTVTQQPPTADHGILEVINTERLCMQRFTDSSANVFIRVRGAGSTSWGGWIKK